MLPSDVQSLIKRLFTRLAPSTVGVVHRILAAVFKAAVRDRRIVASPCEGTKLPKDHRERIEPLSVEAVQALTDAVPERSDEGRSGLRAEDCCGRPDEGRRPPHA